MTQHLGHGLGQNRIRLQQLDAKKGGGHQLLVQFIRHVSIFARNLSERKCLREVVLNSPCLSRNACSADFYKVGIIFPPDVNVWWFCVHFRCTFPPSARESGMQGPQRKKKAKRYGTNIGG